MSTLLPSTAMHLTTRLESAEFIKSCVSNGRIHTSPSTPSSPQTTSLKCWSTISPSTKWFSALATLKALSFDCTYPEMIIFHLPMCSPVNQLYNKYPQSAIGLWVYIFSFVFYWSCSPRPAAYTAAALSTAWGSAFFIVPTLFTSIVLTSPVDSSTT